MALVGCSGGFGREDEMSKTRAQIEAEMDAGFIPNDATQLEFRGAIAQEHTAFYLWRISQKLDRLIDLLEDRKPGSA